MNLGEVGLSGVLCRIHAIFYRQVVGCEIQVLYNLSIHITNACAGQRVLARCNAQGHARVAVVRGVSVGTCKHFDGTPMADRPNEPGFGLQACAFGFVEVFDNVEILDDHIRSVNRVVEIRVNAAIDPREERSLAIVNCREIQAVVGLTKIGAAEFVDNLDPSTVEVGHDIVVAHQ